MISKSFLNFFSGKRSSKVDRKAVARKSLKLEALEDRHMLTVTFEAPIVNDFIANTGDVTVNPELVKHQAVFAADFNNDGKPDFLLIDQNNSTAYTYLNNGQSANAYSAAPITFSPSEGLRLMTQAAIGSVNSSSDSNVDLLTGYAEDDILYFSLYRGNGNGGFYTTPTTSQFNGLKNLLESQSDLGIKIPAGGSVYALLSDLSLVDTNNDGKLDVVCNVTYDIVLADNTTYKSGTISLVFAGDGSGEFKTAPKVISSATFGPVLAAGNMTGGATPEQIVKDGQKLKIKIDGGNTIVTTPQYSHPIGQVWVAQTKTGGANEIIATHNDGTYNYISLTSTTSSAATIKGYYQLDIVPVNVVTGDFNNDGFIDILISDGEVYQTLVGKSDGKFTKEGAVVNHADFMTSYVTDVDGNGVKDVLAVGQRFVWMVPGESTGNNSPGSQIVVDFSAHGITPLDIAFGDFNNDGKTDVAVLSHTGTEVLVFYNTSTNGNPAFGKTETLNVTRGKRLLVANFDNANGDDISVYGVDPSNLSKPTLQTYLSTASGFSSTVRTSTLEKAYDHLAVGDLNNDGVIDIIAITNATSSAAPAYHVLLNNTSNLGRFAKPSNGTVSFGTKATKPTAVAVGDLNGDGRNDLAILDANGKQVYVFPQSTTSPGLFPVSSTPISVTNSTVDEASFKNLVLADFTADGVLDILVGVTGSGGNVQFRILENTTSSPGTFKSDTNFIPVGIFAGDANSSSLAFHVGLIDGNNAADIVIVGGNTVKRLVNINKTGADIGTVTLVFRDYNSAIVNTEVVDLSTLSNRLGYIDEWSNFWVEIWANTGSVAGISEFTTVLAFNGDVFEVRDGHVVAGSAFGNLSHSVSGNNLTISGKVQGSDLQGDNTNTLLARVSFMPVSGQKVSGTETKGLLIDLDYNGYLTPHANGFSIDEAGSRLVSNTGMTGTPTGEVSNDIPLFPMMYDVNDDGVIDLADFTFISNVWDMDVNASGAKTYIKLLDYNQNGRVNLEDFSLFRQNYQVSRDDFRNNPSTNKISYINEFPGILVNVYGMSLQQDLQASMLSEVVEELTAPSMSYMEETSPSQQNTTENSAQNQALLAYVASQGRKSNDFGINDLSPVSETERLLAEGKL